MLELLTPPEAAAYTRTTPGTLTQYRFKKVGSAFVKLGKKVLYRKSDLDSWIEENIYWQTQPKPKGQALAPVEVRAPSVRKRHRLGGHRTKAQERAEREAATRALTTGDRPRNGRAEPA